jgi:hypothetical protein
LDARALVRSGARRDRVAVLLIWLGAQRRMELPAADVVAINAR